MEGLIFGILRYSTNFVVLKVPAKVRCPHILFT